jgi:putative ABC transport system permease protein
MPDWREGISAALAGLTIDPAHEQEIVDELVQHLDDRYAAALAAGVNPEDARRIALDELTGAQALIDELTVAERVHVARRTTVSSPRGSIMANVWQDLRYGFRMLRRNPGLTIVAGLTLALGLGANGAIFSVVHAVLLRELPYREPNQLVMVWESRPKEGVNDNVVSPADFLDWRARQRVFESMAAYEPTTINLTGRGEPQRLQGGHVSASFFKVFGVRPALGRDFRPDEEQPGRNLVVILSDGLWQQQFGGDPRIIGQTITLNSTQHEVIGVLPASFRFRNELTALWHPIDFSAENMRERFNHFLEVDARLKPAMTVERAQQDMDRISAELHREVVLQNQGHGAHVIPLREQLVGDVRLPLLILMTAVAFVLLITCVNVANLMLARGTARAREVAVRSALGAGRLRVVQQLLIECLCLAELGTVAAVPVAMWGITTLRSVVPTEIPRLNDAALELPVIGFMIAVALMTGLAFSLAPALQLMKVNLTDTLKEAGIHAGLSRRRLRKGLVVAEIALAFVLLVGAGLSIRSLFNLLDVAAGVDTENVLTMSIGLTGMERPAQIALFKELLTRVRGVPGVTQAGYVSHVPMSGDDSRSALAVEGLVRTSDEPVRAHWRVVAADYFAAMRIRLLDGRMPSELEAEKIAAVAVINRTAAERYWQGQNPIGKRLRILTPEWREIIGVVDDVRHLGPAAPVNPEVYIPGLRNPTNLIVRSSGDPSALTNAIRAEIRHLSPELPLSAARTMEEVRDRAVASPRFNLILLSTFAAMALVLALVGIYGVMSYTVSQSKADVGLRMAIGAGRADIVQLFVREGLLLTALGLLLGATGAWALTRLMTTLLFGVTPTDAATFAAIAALMGSTAIAACYLPARRAAGVDPLVALRRE